MRRLILSVVTVVVISVLGQITAIAQEASPVPVAQPATFVLVERNENVTNLDLGEPGPSTGDMVVWGPNPFFDEANTTDTGATSQGFCVSLNENGLCMLTETILFPDGSTIELQGVQAGGSGASIGTIVGGSGQYLGATGTVGIQPSEDLATWTKAFEIWV